MSVTAPNMRAAAESTARAFSVFGYRRGSRRPEDLRPQLTGFALLGRQIADLFDIVAPVRSTRAPVAIRALEPFTQL